MQKVKDILILGIESSCDETSAAVLRDRKVLANLIAGQKVHELYGGVVPELASRAHQKNIVPVIHEALRKAGVSIHELDAVAYTRGPGLIGSLLVGSSFAKGLALGLNIPLLEVNHMQAHVLAHFCEDLSKPDHRTPAFPFLCLTVSGGHTQIVHVEDHDRMHVIGETIDDAAGEAFDKSAKLLGLPYPGGPLIDKYGKEGNPERFRFAHPKIDGLDFSFSGLKTSILYFLKAHAETDPSFIEKNKADLCASIQHTIVQLLMEKLVMASVRTGIREIAIAGGVSANSALRSALLKTGKQEHWNTYIPDFQYCTDNAAMIAISGYYKYLRSDFSSQKTAAIARWGI